MGSREGAIKSAARKVGLPVPEYRRRHRQGLKRCTDCTEWKPRERFARDRSRWDGLKARCKRCARKRHQERYEPVPEADRKKPGPDRVQRRDGDVVQARARVNADVRMGLRPNPNDLHCAKCGHKGGDRRHEYHHHMGYGAMHHYDVLVLCTVCHHEEHRDE